MAYDHELEDGLSPAKVFTRGLARLQRPSPEEKAAQERTRAWMRVRLDSLQLWHHALLKDPEADQSHMQMVSACLMPLCLYLSHRHMHANQGSQDQLLFAFSCPDVGCLHLELKLKPPHAALISSAGQRKTSVHLLTCQLSFLTLVVGCLVAQNASGAHRPSLPCASPQFFLQSSSRRSELCLSMPQVASQIDDLRASLGLSLAPDPAEQLAMARRSKRVRGLEVNEDFSAEDVIDIQERQQAAAAAA